jgi:hypothetical protein
MDIEIQVEHIATRVMSREHVKAVTLVRTSVSWRSLMSRCSLHNSNVTHALHNTTSTLPFGKRGQAMDSIEICRFVVGDNRPLDPAEACYKRSLSPQRQVERNYASEYATKEGTTARGCT